MTSITLGGKPVYGALARDNINWFECHTGASRPGIGMFLMVETDYQAIATSGNPVDLVFDDGNSQTINGTKTGTVTIKVFIAGAVAFTTGLDNAQSAVKMMRVIVFDMRRTFTSPTTKAYNAIQFPFTWTSGDFNYYASTENSGSPWTWAQAISDLALPNLPTNPSWKPRNLIFDGTPISRVMDDIAARLWLVVGYDPTSASASSGVSFCKPGTSTNNQALQSAASNFRNAGSDADRNSYAVPGVFLVTFKGYDSSASDPYANRVYTKSVTVGQGTQSMPLNIGDVIAIRSGSSWSNQTELDTIASDIATRAYAFLNTARAEFEYIGIWPFTCDGLIRGIRWSITDDEGAVTQIRQDNEEDWSSIDDIHRIIQLSSNHLIVGLGITNATTNSGGGTKFFWGGGTSPPLLRVLATTWSDSTVLGQGWYRARIVTANTASADPTTSAVDSALFANGGTDVLVLNELEFGLTSPQVRLIDPSAGQVTFLGSPLPSITAAGTFQGVAVYLIAGFNTDEPCSTTS